MYKIKCDDSVTQERCLPRFGIDSLLADASMIGFLKKKKVGLIANQSSLTSTFLSSAYALHRVLRDNLACLFTLEHGWSAFCAAGEKIDNSIEPLTKLPIYSLYGPLFKENVCRIQSLDILIIDVQDVGVRCYTYAATCAKVVEHLSVNNSTVEFFVLDRPNPLGTKIQGTKLTTTNRSLVSYLDVPFQHGEALGGLLQKHNNALASSVPLTVIPGDRAFNPEVNIWIPPSPGLPTWESVLLYPGLVLLEGTNVSEGRGSSLPFRCVAAPKLDFMKLIDVLNTIPNSSIMTHPFSFTPSDGKLAGKECQGAQIQIMNYQDVDGFAIGVYLLHALFHEYPLFEWTRHGTQYWIDQLTGSAILREAISSGRSPCEILQLIT